MKQITFIICPTLQCNINCKHCYVAEARKTHKGILSDREVVLGVKNTLIGLFGWNSEDFENSQVNLIFHGGEPLLMGQKFYEKVIEGFVKEGMNVTFSIQTNFLLYGERWDSLFFKYLNLKTSLGNRMFRGISTSWDFFTGYRGWDVVDFESKILDNIRKYQDSLGQTLKVITVLSKKNKDKIEEIIDFVDCIKTDIKFNFLEASGNAAYYASDDCLSPMEYAMSVFKAFEYYRKKKYNFVLEPIQFYIDAIRDNKKIFNCPFTDNCAEYIFCLVPGGYVYNCLTSFVKGKYFYGNALQNKWLIKNFLKSKVDQISSKECIDCRVCYGGCKLLKKNGKTYFCDSYKYLYEKIQKIVCF